MTEHWRLVEESWFFRAERALCEQGTAAGWLLLLLGVGLTLAISR